MISNPAEETRKNILNKSSNPGKITWDICTEMKTTINHLTELKKDKGLGILLLTIHDNPKIGYYELIEKIDNMTYTYAEVEAIYIEFMLKKYIDFAIEANLIQKTNINKRYKTKNGNSFLMHTGYFITDLGRNLLIQNYLLS